MAITIKVNGDQYQCYIRNHYHENWTLCLDPDRPKWLWAERPLEIPKIQEDALTLACVSNFFIAFFALALSNWDHPLSIHSAVDARQVLANGVIHTLPAHFPQRLVLTSSYGLREGRKALHRGWAGFVVDSDREESDAGTDVLKSQVETFSRQVLHHSCLSVDTQLTFAGDLIRRYGGHFLKLALAEGSANICIRLRREEVEGFLAGQRGTIERVAVTYDELEFNKNPRSWWTPLDEGGAQPVVLLPFPNITDGVGIKLRAVKGPLDNLPLK